MDIYDTTTMKITKEQLKLIFIIGLVGYYTTSLALFMLITMCQLVSKTIHFIYPAIVTAASYFLYKEKTP